VPVPELAQVTVRSPAKINLGLSVGPPRPDGFHPLATVYQAVALYDDVTATVRDDTEVTVEVLGDFATGVPTVRTWQSGRPGCCRPSSTSERAWT
jgi:4-diphosphocytidyl-2-C-methyl-D-erythritol kinase